MTTPRRPTDEEFETLATAHDGDQGCQDMEAEARRARSGEEQAGRERDDAQEQAQHLLNGLSAIEVATAASDREKAALRARVAELEAKLARLASNSALGPIPFMLDGSPQSAELRLRLEFAEQALKPSTPTEQATTLQDPKS